MPPLMTRLPNRRTAPVAPRKPPQLRRARPAVVRADVVTGVPRPVSQVPRIVPAVQRAVRTAAAVPRVPQSAVRAVPTVPADPSPLAGWRGPNPYGEFARTFTDAGGIRLTFKIRDPQAWRTVIRAIQVLGAQLQFAMQQLWQVP